MPIQAHPHSGRAERDWKRSFTASSNCGDKEPPREDRVDAHRLKRYPDLKQAYDTMRAERPYLADFGSKNLPGSGGKSSQGRVARRWPHQGASSQRFRSVLPGTRLQTRRADAGYRELCPAIYPKRKLSAEEQCEHERHQAYLEAILPARPKSGSEEKRESLDEATLKLRSKRMSELIGETAADQPGDAEEGREAADRFYALGVAHLENPQAFREKFNQVFPDNEPSAGGTEP